MTNSLGTTKLLEKMAESPHLENGTTAAFHILLIVAIALIVHSIVKSIRHLSELLIKKSHEKTHPFDFVTQQPKFITLTRLIVSAVTFVVYALAIYFILRELYPTATENTFKTYLTSAAVIGLALSFGMQGLVQDVVTCVTLILSDAMDVGDIVDLMNGVIGRVERIGLRFTKVINFYNQEIFVPNRNINNVSRFPHGGILTYADVQIPATADQQKVVETIYRVSQGTWTQFGAIILTEPVLGTIQSTPGGWNFLRVQFKIWPGQNGLIETTYCSQIVAAMKAFDPNYANWQVVVTYRAMGK
ncbi:MAG TPA: mechanosensitive ion channel family protein [Verrucomicrobiae bacterium]|nr:mechanosensitive ion channel family protein [Verrucomicrobiae bacterium]